MKMELTDTYFVNLFHRYTQFRFQRIFIIKGK